MYNPFLKRLMKDRKEDIIHTSTYAEAQNQGIGSTSSSTFTERQRVEQNRTVVQSYRDAQLVRESLNSGLKAKKYVEPSREDISSQSIKQRLNGGSVQQSLGNNTSAKKSYTPQITPNIKPKF